MKRERGTDSIYLISFVRIRASFFLFPTDPSSNPIKTCCLAWLEVSRMSLTAPCSCPIHTFKSLNKEDNLYPGRLGC